MLRGIVIALLGVIAILGMLQGEYSDVGIAGLVGLSLALGRRRDTHDLFPLVFLYLMAGLGIVVIWFRLMPLL